MYKMYIHAAHGRGIMGGNHPEAGDQIGAAVYLYNQEYIEINNLEVKNQGDNVNRDRSGIRVEGYDYGVIDHIYIRNCYVHDVRGYNGQDDIYPVVPTNPDGSPTDGFTDEDQTNPNTTNTFWGARTTHRTGGINFVTYTARLPESKNEFNVPVQELDETKQITTFNDILIENNTVENCQANGITTTNVAETTQPGCDNDAIAGVVLEQPMAQVIPYGQTSVSVDLASHVYFRTCQAQQPQATQKPEKVPQTGDQSMLLVYVAILASTVLLLSTAVVVRKQTRR